MVIVYVVAYTKPGISYRALLYAYPYTLPIYTLLYYPIHSPLYRPLYLYTHVYTHYTTHTPIYLCTHYTTILYGLTILLSIMELYIYYLFVSTSYTKQTNYYYYLLFYIYLLNLILSNSNTRVVYFIYIRKLLHYNKLTFLPYLGGIFVPLICSFHSFFLALNLLTYFIEQTIYCIPLYLL